MWRIGAGEYDIDPVADGVVCWTHPEVGYAIYDPIRGWKTNHTPWVGSVSVSIANATVAITPFGQTSPTIRGYNHNVGQWVDGPTVPFAYFAASMSRGVAPTNVWFTDMSIAAKNWNWNWNFGDWTYSSERSPYHVYDTPGRYTVSLTVSGPNGTSTTNRTVVVNPVVLWTYTTNGGAINITKYKGFDDAVSIPSTINGLPVTSIGDSAFSDCISLTNITILSNLTSIGNYAFRGCTNLSSITVDALNSFYSDVDGVLFNKDKTRLIQYPLGKLGNGYSIPNSVIYVGTAAFAYCANLVNVTIPNSVTQIGNEAFRSCTSLTNITIPNSVYSLGGAPFIECTNLTSIMVDELSLFYCSVDGVLCDKSTNTLYQFPGGKAGSYTVPDSVTRIRNDAFRSCTRLTSVTIPNSVTNIGGGAFYSCTNLINITIPNGVTRIED